MIETVREDWRCFKEGAPGSRFRGVYERRQQAQQERSGLRRAIPIAIGVVLILAGIAVGWVPGPGGFVGIFGVALLATQFRWLAKVLDWTELRLRGAWRRLWKERSVPARVLVVVVAVAAAAGAAYGVGRLFLG